MSLEDLGWILITAMPLMLASTLARMESGRRKFVYGAIALAIPVLVGVTSGVVLTFFPTTSLVTFRMTQCPYYIEKSIFAGLNLVSALAGWRVLFEEVRAGRRFPWWAILLGPGWSAFCAVVVLLTPTVS